MPKRRRPVTTTQRPARVSARRPETRRSRFQNWLDDVMRPRTSNGLPRSEVSSTRSSRSLAVRAHSRRETASGKDVHDPRAPASRPVENRADRAEIERRRVVVQEEDDAGAQALADVDRVVHVVLLDLDRVAHAHDARPADPSAPRPRRRAGQRAARRCATGARRAVGPDAPAGQARRGAHGSPSTSRERAARPAHADAPEGQDDRREDAGDRSRSSCAGGGPSVARAGRSVRSRRSRLAAASRSARSARRRCRASGTKIRATRHASATRRRSTPLRTVTPRPVPPCVDRRARVRPKAIRRSRERSGRAPARSAGKASGFPCRFSHAMRRAPKGVSSAILSRLSIVSAVGGAANEPGMLTACPSQSIFA